MQKIVFFVCFIFIVTLGICSLFAIPSIAQVQVLELRWTRIVGIQKCIEKEHHDQYLANPQRAGIAISSCLWVWDGVRKESGTNTLPIWPNTSDLSVDSRIAIQSEIYQGTLKPTKYARVRWSFSSSDESLYTEFFDALQNNRTIPRVTSIFGQVVRV